MADQVHRHIVAALADIAFGSDWANIDSLANGSIAWSAQQNGFGDADIVRVFLQIMLGTSPTAETTFQVFVARADDDASEIREGGELITTSSGTNGTAATIERVLPQLKLIGAQRVAGVTDIVYRTAYDIENPGDDWSLVIKNETGAAFNGTSSPHQVHAIGYGWIGNQ